MRLVIGKSPWVSPVYRSLTMVLRLSLMLPEQTLLVQMLLAQKLTAVVAQGPVSMMAALAAILPDD